MAGSTKRSYRFTFGPWNISTGSDPFGPPVRQEVAFAEKIRACMKFGFDGLRRNIADNRQPFFFA